MKTEYEIGRYYSVPTVTGNLATIRHDWPVFSDKHEDREIIGFDHVHYHVDWRFVSLRMFSRVANLRYYTTSDKLYGLVLHEGPMNDNNLPAPIMRRRKYRGSFEQVLGTFPKAKWMDKLVSTYATCRLKNMTCPHRNISLANCPVVNGIVTCPGHGLRWNVETGKVVV